ncbi:MAG: DUF1127 domain-containing protein [Rhodobacteraceae bacterium]|jgi:hypothetical protein|nr:DUF1127 domain-containing protein [Paracoccaceae bacterium]
MAQITLDGFAPARGVSSILNSVWDFILAYAETKNRSDRIAALEALSNEELAARGLTRSGIVSHVFSDIGFL